MKTNEERIKDLERRMTALEDIRKRISEELKELVNLGKELGFNHD